MGGALECGRLYHNLVSLPLAFLHRRQQPMRQLVLVIALSLLLPTVAFAQDRAPDTKALDNEMARILKLDQLQKSRVGIHAVDVETGEILYSRNADEAFNPASNMKLVTAAAALERLGPEFVWVTRVSARGVSEDGTVEGPLYLKGEGDPLLMWEDLLAFAGQLRAQGVTSVPDGIVVDDTEFAGDFIPPGFEQKDEDAAYRAPMGAVSLNYNAQTVVVRPGAKTGDPAVAYLMPPNESVDLVNRVKTSSGTRARIGGKSETDGDGTRITITGSIGARADAQTVRKRIDNPSLFAGTALKKALALAGIDAVGEVRRGERPTGTKTLVYHESMPLAHAVFLMNKWSNNFIAEMLYRKLGHDDGPATTEAARKAVEAFVARAGAGGDGFRSKNGSGLYDGNQLTPKQIVTLLDYMVDRPTYPEFASALAVAGQDGTLRSRLGKGGARGTLRGKTGTLNNVTALSGYLTTRSGRQVAYAILINDPPVKAWHLRRVQDELAEALVSYDH